MRQPLAYRVVTTTSDFRKTQVWHTETPLLLPKPFQLRLVCRDGQLLGGQWKPGEREGRLEPFGSMQDELQFRGGGGSDSLIRLERIRYGMISGVRVRPEIQVKARTGRGWFQAAALSLFAIFLASLVFGFFRELWVGPLEHWWRSRGAAVQEPTAQNQPVSTAPITIQEAVGPAQLPEGFLAERKKRLAEPEKSREVERIVEMQRDSNSSLQKQAQAVQGEGGLPPGGKKDGPPLPAPALGNGLAPAVNGGQLGTLQGDIKEAAPLEKTIRVQPSQVGAAPSGLGKAMAQSATAKGAKLSGAIALQKNHAGQLLERQNLELAQAFSAALRYMNEEDAPSALARTTAEGANDTGAPKRGGLLLHPEGQGTGVVAGLAPSDANRVLGQVGSIAGRGIQGGTGGAPNGVAGGPGLSARFQGTGDQTGTGVGGVIGGSPFVELSSKGGFSGTVTEGLDQSEVGKVIYEHAAEVKKCYEAGLALSPGLQGRIVVEFAISPQGRVSDARAAEDTTGSTVLPGCLLGKLRSWVFPKPRGGVTVQVKYPFQFRMLGAGGGP
jgi:hypothetical protein